MLIAAAALAGCTGKKTADVQQETRVLTKTETAVSAPVQLAEEFTSEIEPYKQNDITPAASGVHIDRILVEVGDPVRQGQLIVTLDPTQYTQQLVQLKTVEDANLRKNIEVHSPITGVVTARNYESGDLFAAQPILHIMQIDPLKVVANISEQYFRNVKVGMPVDLKVDIFPGETFPGTVSLIYPALDPATRTFKVEVKVPNAKRTLRPGMFARTGFNMGEKEGVMVPDVAVQKQVGTAERFLYVIKGDSVAERRRVEVGRQVGDRVDILSGVAPGERVAVTALSKLFDGAKVEVKQN